MNEVKVRLVKGQIIPGSKTIVTIVELRFFNNRAYFISPNSPPYDQPTELRQAGDLVVDKFDNIVLLTNNDSESYMRTCTRILVTSDQIPAPIKKLIDSGEMKEYNRVAIEAELVVKIKDGSANDDVYHKIKFDKDNKVSVVSFERLLNEKSEPKARNNELLQLMHDTMSPVNSIKGTVFLLKPMVAEKLSIENNSNQTNEIKLIAQWVIDNRHSKSEHEKVDDFSLYNGIIDRINALSSLKQQDEFLSLLAKLLNAVETKANQLNEVLDAYYVSRKGPVFSKIWSLHQ